MIQLKSYHKKENTEGVLATLGKNTEAQLIDVNGKDTKLILAIKSNVLLYSLADNQFISSYEGHANTITHLKFMDYTIDQKKNVDGVLKEYFISTANTESFGNVWRSSKKEKGKTITAPVKMLELTDKKTILGVQIKQVAAHYYFATMFSNNSVRGFVCNMKAKDKNIVKKCDFKVSLDKAITKKNLYIMSTNIVNESEIVLFKGNSHKLESHYFTYLNEDGGSPGTDIVISPESQKAETNGEEKNGDTKMLGLEYDQIQANSAHLQNGIFNGIDINELENRADSVLKQKSKSSIKTGSLVAVLEQSLHANDIETINWVLSNTDPDVITLTVSSLKKDFLKDLMNSLIIKLQQGVQKSSLLWLGVVLKLRWLDVMKHQSNISSLHTYFSRKSKNLYKYYELQGKLQMVVDSGMVITANADMEVDVDEESKQPLVFQKDESDEEADEIVEDIDLADDRQVFEEDEEDERRERDSDDESKMREELEKYGDDVLDDENEDEDLEMDEDDDEGDHEEF